MAFNTVIRKIFKLSKHTSVRHVIHYIGSKPCKIFIDERRRLLISSRLTSCYASVKNIAFLFILSDDFNRLCVNYDICYLYKQHEIRQSFCKYMDVYVTLSRTCRVFKFFIFYILLYLVIILYLLLRSD